MLMPWIVCLLMQVPALLFGIVLMSSPESPLLRVFGVVPFAVGAVGIVNIGKDWRRALGR